MGVGELLLAIHYIFHVGEGAGTGGLTPGSYPVMRPFGSDLAGTGPSQCRSAKQCAMWLSSFFPALGRRKQEEEG